MSRKFYFKQFSLAEVWSLILFETWSGHYKKKTMNVLLFWNSTIVIFYLLHLFSSVLSGFSYVPFVSFGLF